MRRKPPGYIGECAEAKFNDVATALGFITARLWSNSRPFDFFLAWGRLIYRIQVKATGHFTSGGYHLSCYRSRKRPYTLRHADFIAAYVWPVNAWYIIPVRVLHGNTTLTFYPTVENAKGKYERYRERWDLLRR